MRDWLRGRPGGLAAFLLIAGLVLGALGWATHAALRLEERHAADRADAEEYSQLRFALWRLDSWVLPQLAREDSRPFDHYSALFAPPQVFDNKINCRAPGSVLEPSPLLHAELPDWMALHFQVDVGSGWRSPQVLDSALNDCLWNDRVKVPKGNVTPEREKLRARLAKSLRPEVVLAAAQERAQRDRQDQTLLPSTVPAEQELQQQFPPQIAQQSSPPLPYAPNDNAQQGGQQGGLGQNEGGQAVGRFSGRRGDYEARIQYQSKVVEGTKNPQIYNRDLALGNSSALNGRNWIGTPGTKVTHGVETKVYLSRMAPVWLTGADGEDHLLFVRTVKVEDRELCQGVVVDVPQLEQELLAEVADLFPLARLLPMREAVPPRPERTMAALPFELDPGVLRRPAGSPGWTPLRVGLALSWAAALVALLAVGLGGWSLWDLSERRMRFVSAVTHELRTPLTTLQLYLDMLTGGMVRDEQQREEYLRTLHAESDRLSRLVGNVLDFSRLEKQRPMLVWADVSVADVLAHLEAAWKPRCQNTGKELIVENAVGPGVLLHTDAALLQQIVGNLLDNACKYSREAEDHRLWLRLRTEDGSLVVEVEDRGPGIPPGERRTIFRAFRRGRRADAPPGGVGLGLSLAQRWTRLLGGRLNLGPTPVAGGACFRLVVPGLVAGTKTI
jgi:signal transduction histidine kinase